MGKTFVGTTCLRLRSLDKMSELNRLDHKAAIKLWLDARKVIFYCGSAVSMFQPTCLPTGSELVQTCIKSIKNSLELSVFKRTAFGDLSKLPLETLVGLIVDDVSDVRHSKIIASIADYFADVTPNGIHYLLGSFLVTQKDRHIVTTNYDLGFEKAIQAITEQTGKIARIDTVGYEKLGSIKSVDRNTIFKIHGCARLDRPQDLVLTTKQESSGLPSVFTKSLEKLFDESLVVFLGYSLSEPDCLEALMNVTNCDVIWTVRSAKEFRERNDRRVTTILDNARQAYFLEDLSPLLADSWDDLCPQLTRYGFRQVRNQAPHLPSIDPTKIRAKGLRLFQRLAEISNKEKLGRVLISAHLQMRRLDLADQYLADYKTLPRHSPFLFHFWTASSQRESGAWRNARDTFAAAADTKEADSEQRLAALAEQLGLDTLLAQGSDTQLAEIENQLRDLVSFSKNHLTALSRDTRLGWLSILGRLQKNLVQNISYQGDATIGKIEDCLAICHEAIANLKESRTIQARIEVERFEGRIHFRLFKATGDKQHLDQAIKATNKSMQLFSLLGVMIGEINAKRQYAHYLLAANLTSRAGEEIEELLRLVAATPDKLSKVKAELIAIVYYYQSKQRLLLARSVIASLRSAATVDDTRSFVENLAGTLKWFRSFLQGRSG
jgi:hypothetical protein